MSRFALLAILVASPAIADGFRDNYEHATNIAIRITEPEEATTTDSSSGTLTAVQRGNDVTFTWTDGGQTCKLAGKVKGETIRFLANQSCTIDDDATDSLLKLTLVAGQGTVDEDGNLDLAISWKIRGSSGGHAISGSANQRTSAVPR